MRGVRCGRARSSGTVAYRLVRDKYFPVPLEELDQHFHILVGQHPVLQHARELPPEAVKVVEHVRERQALLLLLARLDRVRGAFDEREHGVLALHARPALRVARAPAVVRVDEARLLQRPPERPADDERRDPPRQPAGVVHRLCGGEEVRERDERAARVELGLHWGLLSQRCRPARAIRADAR